MCVFSLRVLEDKIWSAGKGDGALPSLMGCIREVVIIVIT